MQVLPSLGGLYVVVVVVVVVGVGWRSGGGGVELLVVRYFLSIDYS